MFDGEHILISLEDRHAENILAGRKFVELRRRFMNVAIGTTIWIYVKLPVGAVVGRARVSAVHSLAPSTLWRRFGAISGLTHREFGDYFEGVTTGFALTVEEAERLPRPISLRSLRQMSCGFQPPQFFMRLSVGGDLLNAFSETQSDCVAFKDGVRGVEKSHSSQLFVGADRKAAKSRLAVCQ